MNITKTAFITRVLERHRLSFGVGAKRRRTRRTKGSIVLSVFAMPEPPRPRGKSKPTGLEQVQDQTVKPRELC